MFEELLQIQVIQVIQVDTGDGDEPELLQPRQRETQLVDELKKNHIISLCGWLMKWLPARPAWPAATTSVH